MVVAYIVLAITSASLLAAGMPLLNAIIGVLIGVTGLHALSGLIDVSETAPILATMLGLAVGIDYALFILSRHREGMEKGSIPRKRRQATATAGSAVVFAGSTVVIALVGLVVVGIPFLTVMGLAAAGTVTIAVLIALTLLPALLGFAQPARLAATGSCPGAVSARPQHEHPLGAVRGRSSEAPAGPRPPCSR